MASRRRKEKRKHHLVGPRTNPSEGRATLLARGSGHPDPREARRAHRPGLPGVGRRRLGRRPRPHRRGSPEQHHLRSAPGRPASELPNPDGQNGLSGPPPPPSQLTAVHRRAPRPVPPCGERTEAATLPTPSRPRSGYLRRWRRSRRHPNEGDESAASPEGFGNLWKTCSALGDSCSLRTRTGRRHRIPPPLSLPPSS